MKLNALTTLAQVAAFLAGHQARHLLRAQYEAGASQPTSPHSLSHHAERKKAWKQNDFCPHAPLPSLSALFEACT